MNSLDRFINEKVVILDEDDTLLEASQALCQNNIGCVVVADAYGSLVGLLTDRDIACGISTGEIYEDTMLGDIIEPGLLWASENDSVQDVIDLMTENAIRRVPIVRESGDDIECVGIVTLDDLITQRSISLEQAAQIIEAQIGNKSFDLHSKTPAHIRPDFARF